MEKNNIVKLHNFKYLRYMAIFKNLTSLITYIIIICKYEVYDINYNLYRTHILPFQLYI